jgi:hypothetical protein
VFFGGADGWGGDLQHLTSFLRDHRVHHSAIRFIAFSRHQAASFKPVQQPCDVRSWSCEPFAQFAARQRLVLRFGHDMQHGEL